MCASHTNVRVPHKCWVGVWPDHSSDFWDAEKKGPQSKVASQARQIGELGALGLTVRPRSINKIERVLI